MSYLELSKGLMAEAMKALDLYKKTKSEVELRQACEKGFGAFAQVLMFYKSRELHHSEFGDVVDELVIKTSNRDIDRAQRDAEALHASFYHRTLSLRAIEDALNQIETGIRAIIELK